MNGSQLRLSDNTETSIFSQVSRQSDLIPEEDPAEKIITSAAVIYVFLWIVEGAFRKWIPELDATFYVARDAFLIFILAYVSVAFARRRSSNILFWPLTLCLFSLTILQVILGKVDLLISVFGFRSYIAPLLLLYAVWRYQPKTLVKQVSKLILIMAPFEAVITVLQVSSPASSWINKQVGDELTYFINYGGFVRATGSFTSPSGLTAYIPLCLAVAIPFLSDKNSKTRILSLVATISCLIMTGIGGSRGAILSVGIVLFVFFLKNLVTLGMTAIRNLFIILSVVLCSYVFLQSLFPNVLISLLNRFQDASVSEDSASRLFMQTFSFFGVNFDLIGSGSGANSSAGVILGSKQAWVETDSEKWVVELGFFGYLAAVARLVLGTFLLWKVFRHLRTIPELTLLLLAVWIPSIIYGGITQNPTLQGAFSILAGMVYLTWHNNFYRVNSSIALSNTD